LIRWIKVNTNGVVTACPKYAVCSSLSRERKGEYLGSFSFFFFCYERDGGNFCIVL